MCYEWDIEINLQDYEYDTFSTGTGAKYTEIIIKWEIIHTAQIICNTMNQDVYETIPTLRNSEVDPKFKSEMQPLSSR